MTTKTHGNSLLLDAELERITTDLELANTDMALLERLRSAKDRAARLTDELEKATAAMTKALAAEAKERDRTRFGGIADVSVSAGKTENENVVRSQWTISYTTPAFDGRMSRMTPQSRSGFGQLPPEVLDYIIEKRPELIPAKIMKLAPNSPRDAFRRYFVAMRRGFVHG